MPYSLHAYQYAYSAPTVWTDPSGESPLVCLVPAVVDGPLPVGDAVSVVCLVGYGLYAGAVALAGVLIIDTAVTTLPGMMTPPLDPGPRPSPVLGDPANVPVLVDHRFPSPLTGPEEACWVIPGPLLMPPPWPFTTGAPLDPVAGPVVVEARMSELLHRNMQAAGIPRPPGTAAHHIVAWDDRRAAVARAILAAANIGINDAINGVYLPRNKSFFTVGNARHSDIHTDVYYREVENRLSAAPLPAISTVLRRMATEIEQGLFPK